jgi:hypothetical protein
MLDSGEMPPLAVYRLSALSVGVLSPSIFGMLASGEWIAPGMMLSMWLLSPYLLLIAVSFVLRWKRALWLALVGLAATGSYAGFGIGSSRDPQAALGFVFLPILQAAFVLPAALFVGWAIDTVEPDR